MLRRSLRFSGAVVFLSCKVAGFFRRGKALLQMDYEVVKLDWCQPQLREKTINKYLVKKPVL